MSNAIVNRKEIHINTYLRDAQKMFVLSVKTSYKSVWGFLFSKFYQKGIFIHIT